MLGYRLINALIFLILFFSCMGWATPKSEHIKKTAAVLRAIAWAAEKAEVPEELLLAVCYVESNFKNVPPRQDGGSNSYGICQVKLETAQHMDFVYKHKMIASPERLSEVYINAFYAGKVLHYNLSRYDGDWDKAIESFNKGSALSGGNGKYVQKVYNALEHKVPAVRAQAVKGLDKRTRDTR